MRRPICLPCAIFCFPSARLTLQSLLLLLPLRASHLLFLRCLLCFSSTILPHRFTTSFICSSLVPSLHSHLLSQPFLCLLPSPAPSTAFPTCASPCSFMCSFISPCSTSHAACTRIFACPATANQVCAAVREKCSCRLVVLCTPCCSCRLSSAHPAPLPQVRAVCERCAVQAPAGVRTGAVAAACSFLLQCVVLLTALALVWMQGACIAATCIEPGHNTVSLYQPRAATCAAHATQRYQHRNHMHV